MQVAEWVVPLGKRPILKAPKTLAGYPVIDIPSNVALVVGKHLASFCRPRTHGLGDWHRQRQASRATQPLPRMGAGTQHGGAA